MNIINERYQILELIDKSVDGKIYKVMDLEDSKIYSLKLFNKNVDKNYIIEFSNLFFNYTKVIHPNILRDYRFDIINDFNFANRQYFCVYEYIDSSLELSYATLSESDRLKVLEKIIYALKYLHFKNIPYNNLFFNNINIFGKENGEIEVKLSSVANCSQSDASIFSDGLMKKIDSLNRRDRSDILNLAHVSYYLITGKDYQKFPVELELDIKPKYPELYEVMKLSTGPYEDRPKDVDDMWRVLNKTHGISTAFWDKKYYEMLDYKVELIGKDDELIRSEAMIQDFFHNEGRTGSIFIKSGIGNGKSRFLNELKHKLRIKSLNPIYCDLNSGTGSYKGYNFFSSVVKKILEKFPVSYSFVKEYGGDIVKLVPEYMDKWNIKPSETLDGEEEVIKLKSRIISLIMAVAKTNNFVIILDDVDKMNEEDLNTLYELMSITSARRPFLVISINYMPFEYEGNDLIAPYEYIELTSFNHSNTVDYLMKLLYIDFGTAKMLARSTYSLVHGNPKNIKSSINYLIEKGYIYVSDERKYVVKNFDKMKFSYEKDREYVELMDTISRLSLDSVYIAKLFSVYANKFDVFFALQFTKLPPRRFDLAMRDLIRMKIFRKLSSNWGNYYDFFDYRVLSAIYMSLTEEEKVKFHGMCKDFYEEAGDFDDSEFDSYVYHLVNSGNPKKSVEILIKKSGEKSRENKFGEVLDYLAFAKVIVEDLNDTNLSLKLLIEESRALYKFGNVNKLEVVYRNIIKIANSDAYLNYRVYALMQLANLLLYTDRSEEFKNIYAEIKLAKKKKSGYIDRELSYKLDILDLRYYSIIGDMALLISKADILIKDSEKQNLEHINLYCRYYKATNLLISGDYKRLEDELKDLISIAEEKNYLYHLVEFYNYLGELYLYRLYENDLARDYLLKAEKLAGDVGFVWVKCKIYYNLGIAFRNVGDFSSAYDNSRKAEMVAEKTHQKKFLYRCINLDIETLLLLENYEAATNKLDKFEKIAITSVIKPDNSDKYYNLILDAYLSFNYKKFEEVGVKLNFVKQNGFDYFNDEQKISYFKLKFIHAYVNIISGNEDVELIDISVIEKMEIPPFERELFVSLLLTIALVSYALKRFDFFSFIMSVIDRQSYSDYFREKSENEEFLRMIINEEDMMDIKLFAFSNNVKDQSYLWQFYFIIGNMEYDRGNKYETLFFYYEAMNKYYNRLKNFGEIARLEYIKSDVAFNELLNKIIILKEELFGQQVSSVEEMYFNDDPELRDALIHNKTIKNILGAIYIKLSGNYFPTINDYITLMSDDNQRNIENMLLHFMHSTMSERACMIILDEDDNIVDTFNALGGVTPSDFMNCIPVLKKSEDYILIEKNNTSKQNFDCSSDRNLLVFPICRRPSCGNLFRRSDDVVDCDEKVSAYVYLESTMAISEINLEKLTEIRTYDGLYSMVIDNYNLYKKSSVDKLTGVFIRSVVERHVESIISKTENMNYSFSVIMLDIDNFKYVNDNYGHRRGDEILVGLARVLKETLRKKDVVGRYGGEEFIIVINNADQRIGYMVAEKIRAEVESAKLMGQDGELTVSVGVSTYPTDGSNFAKLVENADRALYASKRNGKNRVTSYTEDLSGVSLQGNTFAGVFSTNASENAMKVKAILDISRLVATDFDTKTRLEKALNILMAVVDAREICILFKDRSYMEDISVKKNLDLKDGFKVNGDLKNHIMRIEEAGHYVDWEDENNIKKDNARTDYTTYAFADIVKNGISIGRLAVFSSIKTKEFGYKDYSYIQSLSSVIAGILNDK